MGSRAVAAWKAKEVLAQRGMLDKVEAAVAAANGLVQRAWTGAAEWNRDSRFVAELAKRWALTRATWTRCSAMPRRS